MRTTTTRGLLWEMLLPLIRWPMRSPWRLAGVLVGAVVLIAIVARLSSTPNESVDTSPAAASTTEAPSATPMPSTEPSVEASSQELRAIAKEFVAAWAHPERTADEWWQGLQGIPLDESLAQALGQTDPATIPATAVTGRPMVVSTAATDAQVWVRTDGPTVLVVLVRHDAGWQVANILPTAD